MTTTRTGRDEPAPDADPDRAVVALAGTFCSPLVFEQVRPLLGDRFDVRALSWMTNAPSCTIDGAAAWVADSAPPGPLLLVGHSTGGAIALRLALTRPELVGGLMLINTRTQHAPPRRHHDPDLDRGTRRGRRHGARGDRALVPRRPSARRPPALPRLREPGPAAGRPGGTAQPAHHRPRTSAVLGARAGRDRARPPRPRPDRGDRREHGRCVPRRAAAPRRRGPQPDVRSAVATAIEALDDRIGT